MELINLVEILIITSMRCFRLPHELGGAFAAAGAVAVAAVVAGPSPALPAFAVLQGGGRGGTGGCGGSNVCGGDGNAAILLLKVPTGEDIAAVAAVLAVACL